MKNQFWKEKDLSEMNEKEWESLCDGCGLCCLISLVDEDSGDLALTNVVCKYINMNDCSCSDYKNRCVNVPDCLKVTPENIDDLYWMPQTCAYRLLNEGKELYPWHHLVSGSKEAVHEAGISMKGKMIKEDKVEDYEDYVIGWQNIGKMP